MISQEQLKKELEKAKNYLLVVEGKKDKAALLSLGFKHIFILNETGKSLYEKIEQIEAISQKNKVCILTDFDKKGKKLYLLLKSQLAQKVKLDNSLRYILLKSKISHIEGLASFMKHNSNQ